MLASLCSSAATNVNNRSVCCFEMTAHRILKACEVEGSKKKAEKRKGRGDEGANVFRNIGNSLPVGTASYTRTSESVATPL
jgi:hypothetical protein